MLCDMLRCVNNAEGYCMCSSYVEIDETGCCREIYIKSMEENERHERAIGKKAITDE